MRFDQIRISDVTAHALVGSATRRSDNHTLEKYKNYCYSDRKSDLKMAAVAYELQNPPTDVKVSYESEIIVETPHTCSFMYDPLENVVPASDQLANNQPSCSNLNPGRCSTPKEVSPEIEDPLLPENEEGFHKFFMMAFIPELVRRIRLNYSEFSSENFSNLANRYLILVCRDERCFDS